MELTIGITLVIAGLAGLTHCVLHKRRQHRHIHKQRKAVRTTNLTWLQEQARYLDAQRRAS